MSVLNVVSFPWVTQRFLVEVVAYCFPNGVAACECQEMSSCTSSYPDSCEVSRQRPKCLACLTAATRGSAPSNPRTNTGFASCSYEQEPPDRKRMYTLSLPEAAEARMKLGVKSGCEGYALIQPKSAIVQRPVRQRHRSMASWRARAMTVFFRIEVPSASLTFMR